MKRYRVVGINFDHMHMVDLLKKALAHPQVDVIGVSDEDPARVAPAMDLLGLPKEKFSTTTVSCSKKPSPIWRSSARRPADMASGRKKVAPSGAHVLMEKPFAASLSEADRMIAALASTGKQLAINWPLRWYAPYVTAKRICDEGQIGEVLEVHHYGGNRGPLGRLKERNHLTDEKPARKSPRAGSTRRAPAADRCSTISAMASPWERGF